MNIPSLPVQSDTDIPRALQVLCIHVLVFHFRMFPFLNFTCIFARLLIFIFITEMLWLTILLNRPLDPVVL